jgi:hypothetical protein
MTAQRLECLLRTVRRRGEPVRTQADPGEERDQREPVKEVAVGEVAWSSDQPPFEATGYCLGSERIGHLLSL